MSSLSRARCLHHLEREAAARCPACGRDFCRECVVEHAGRLLCRNCLEGVVAPIADGRRRFLMRSVRVAATALGVLLAWLFFFALGDLLARLPSATHGVAP